MGGGWRLTKRILPAPNSSFVNNVGMGGRSWDGRGRRSKGGSEGGGFYSEVVARRRGDDQEGKGKRGRGKEGTLKYLGKYNSSGIQPINW